MLRKIFRGFVIGCVLGVTSLVAVGEGEAVCSLFQRKYDTAAAMYPGSACTPCGQQLVCNYVPQTCYRVQYVTVPTTTYRPVTTCNPCGGQTTAMLPQTAYVQQARYMPYTTYRLSYSIAQPTCPTTTAYYAAPQVYAAPGAAVAPMVGVPAMAAPTLAAPAPAGGCSSCGSRGAATTYYAPSAPGAATSYYAPSTSYPVAPSFASPTTGYTYAQPSPAAPSYSVPNNSVPSNSVPSNTGAPTYYRVPAAAVPGTAPPAGSVIINNGAATVAPSLPSTPSYSAAPAMPTPAPPLGTTSPSPPKTYERQVDPQSTDAMKPIPDPQISTPTGPKLGPTSAPRLYDPQDKTAIAWPVERAWSYAPIGASEWKPATSVAAVAERQPIMQAAVLETPVMRATPAATVGPIGAPTTASPRPTIDADGWQSSGR